MEVATHSKPAKDKTYALLTVLAFCLPPMVLGNSPHISKTLIWTVSNVETGKKMTLAQGYHALNTWWPDLTFDLCKLAEGSWQNTQRDKGDTYPPCRFRSWYLCPGRSRTWQCGGPEHYFCASWGCETSSNGYWLKGKPRNDYVQFSETTTGESNITIKFTEEGKKQIGWLQGYLWGARLYTPSQYNPGLLLRLQLETRDEMRHVGPNSVLAEQRVPSQSLLPVVMTPSANHSPASSISPPNTTYPLLPVLGIDS
ncbi:hypothetical protein H1C71_024643 [Ictidomys tridecemlineatus]|nr:hypothetical protein H1C71_024643 [Ictidomys tridecemlineatus]